MPGEADSSVEVWVDGHPASSAHPLAVAVESTTAQSGTATHTADATVAGTATDVLAANTSRKGAIIQNTHASANARVRIGADAAAATGVQLGPGQSLTLKEPHCPTARVSAIREGSTSVTIAVVEIV